MRPFETYCLGVANWERVEACEVRRIGLLEAIGVENALDLSSEWYLSLLKS